MAKSKASKNSIIKIQKSKSKCQKKYPENRQKIVGKIVGKSSENLHKTIKRALLTPQGGRRQKIKLALKCGN